MTRPTLDSRASVSVLEDPRDTARRLRDLHARWSDSAVVPSGVRTAIARAWSRQEPRPSTAPEGHLADAAVVDRRARATELTASLPHLESTLLDVATEASNELVVCDAEGYVLWVRGPSPVRRSSERLGFVEGACWTEAAVGTNGLGTALVDATPIQVFGAEHTDEGHHGWVCTGAPITSPRTGRPIGALTLSGPLRSAHPNTVALVSGAVRLAEQRLAVEHRIELDRIRRSGDGLLGTGPVLLVDDHGWVIQSQGLHVGERIRLPARLQEGAVWTPALGVLEAGRVPGGWTLRPSDSADTRLVVHPGSPAFAQVHTAGRCDQVPITGRQAAILRVLAEHPDGLSGERLVAEAYDQPVSLVTLRAEISRLRSRIGPVIDARPYRLTVPAHAA